MQIPLAFDFDAPLTPDSSHGLLERVGVSVHKYRTNTSHRISLAFSLGLAKMGKLIQLEREARRPQFIERVLRDWDIILPFPKAAN